MSLFNQMSFNSSGATTEISWPNDDNTMTVDALAPWLAESSESLIAIF